MTVPEITAEEAQNRLTSATFLDVRDGGSWRIGHVPGALHVGDHNIADFVATADRERPVVVYCYHGHSSLGGAAYLLEQGFADVASMEGGFAAWHGRPTEAGPVEPPRRPAPPRQTPPTQPPRASRRQRWMARLRSLKG